MIAVDTSALMAIVLNEASGPACEHQLDGEPELVISAATLAEALIVSQGRNVAAAMRTLIEGLDLNVLPVTAQSAQRVGDIYKLWGCGHHAANLNFGDCFAYDAANVSGCPLLYVGNDFSKTDICAALKA